MLSVTQLARKTGISRTTVLYYERAGLITPTNRSDNGYRWYGDNEIKRLETIVAYRAYGLPVSEIASLLEHNDTVTQEVVLKEQFNALELEIKKLRQQQKAIVLLLEQNIQSEQDMVNKDRWVAIMEAAGFTEQDMHNWHIQFEKMEPQGHEDFLKSLSISEDEVKQIRQWAQDSKTLS
ncbi:MerR family transcriptional regulator [Enterovibrio nigricans]|uniref:Transcriptional regulator, MerR family n=1 Tax=Enterovibrio nigricans DSM 22720 TaxID=1121868 RepID=A0A1T4VSR3_9GAMM|nr:MerR family transcriptional regulator [Enterovibrio nigricans]PKF49187.1 MerR family transcriptional regulator [Enterovibrio nigricans]SKA67865.1 transcriptional regulator, MerR family [Enterovibrio nigricans DSM 22720]